MFQSQGFRKRNVFISKNHFRAATQRMAPGGVIHAIQESCSAFRSFFTDRVHRSSGRFLSQSDRCNKWHDTDADGRWYAIASVTAFWEGLFADSGWNAAATAAAIQGGCDRASRVRVFQVGNLLLGSRKAFPAAHVSYFQSGFGMLTSGRVRTANINSCHLGVGHRANPLSIASHLPAPSLSHVSALRPVPGHKSAANHNWHLFVPILWV